MAEGRRKGLEDGPPDEANRQRRLGDAAKLLPVLAAVLMALPTLWMPGTATSFALIYIFAVWGALILVIALLSRTLSRFVARGEERSRLRGPER